MKNYYFKFVLFCTSLFTLYLIDLSSQQIVRILDLDEGDICRRGRGSEPDYVCLRERNCEPVLKNGTCKNYRNHLNICSFDGKVPIVCCPTTVDKKTKRPIINTDKSADQVCKEYSELTYDEPLESTSKPKPQVKPLTLSLGGRKEFPHMVLLGYGTTAEEDLWGCGGSLISERWILTAGHCLQLGPLKARWARIGISIVHQRIGKDYQIVQHIGHPQYKPPSRYNDLALLGLEKEVEFSKYVKPICLNSNQGLNPKEQIATGWGKIATEGLPINDLLKVDLKLIAANKCNSSYFSIYNLKQLQFGITSDNMICAGTEEPDLERCGGDSGGPLQVENFNESGMFMQFGITSFGKFCGDKDTPGVYTRVSKFISWIEGIVWNDPQEKERPREKWTP